MFVYSFIPIYRIFYFREPDRRSPRENYYYEERENNMTLAVLTNVLRLKNSLFYCAQ